MCENTSEDRDSLISEWHIFFKKGTDFDLWGQPVEAVNIYKRLSSEIRQEATTSATCFSDESKKILNKVAACLELRTKALQNPGAKIRGVSFEDLKKVESYLPRAAGDSSSRDFPVEISAAVVHSPQRSGDTTSEVSSQASKDDPETEETPSAEEIVDQRTRGTVLPPPQAAPGQTLLAIRVEKIGLKDATQYMDPFITVAVKDAGGVNVTAIQDTPVAAHKDDIYVIFGADLFLQKPLELLPPNFAIFFEFKHYKPQKKIVSTKCWSMLEKDEIKEGEVVLELYKKPADYRRKKINLLTVKPLYLHLKLTLTS